MSTISEIFKKPSPASLERWNHRFATITSPSASVSLASSSPYTFRLHYVDVPAYSNRDTSHDTSKPKGTILLIHGFPQTWWQWRHVIGPFSDAGYRIIVPDYRGAGNSQAPPSNAGHAGGKGGGYTKLVIADDLHNLVHDILGIHEKVHIVGHDIGAMVAHAYVSWFPEDSASLVWGDCPLPGSTFYEEFKKDQAVWHFTFHNVEDDLPERLVQGHERTYIRHFFDRLSVNVWGIPPGGEDEDVYVTAYSRPGAFRAAFDTYRTFEEDARENRELVEKSGKSKVPALGVSGDGSFNNARAEEQLKEFYDDVEVVSLRNSGHWIAEENPKEFFEKVLAWIQRDE
ncbi:MAG: hypothetical protein Q9195_007376 [Heterodermia aff. obscurata]